MQRRDLLLALGGAAMPVSSGRPLAEPFFRKTPRPNILVFLSDNHARWLQQAYGNSEVRTPNMQRLAQRGLRMTNAFTISPVCSPARSGLNLKSQPLTTTESPWLLVLENRPKHSLPVKFPGGGVFTARVTRPAGRQSSDFGTP